MKVKFSLIPFIPAALAMIFFRVMSLFGADESGRFLGMDMLAVSYTVIAIAVVLFLVCVVINILDKKTAPVYPVQKNYAAGVFAALSGASVIAYSISKFMTSSTNSEYYVMSLISAFAAIPAGIALFLMVRVHFQGKTIVSSTSIFFICPAIWGCTEIVYQFLEATKVSISAMEMTPLFSFIFLTLYYFSHAMVVSRIKGRNPVKACFIYGLPAVALSLSYGVYALFAGLREGGGLVSVLRACMFLALGVYACIFIAEMAFNFHTKDEVEIIDGLPELDEIESEEKKYIETEDFDELIIVQQTDESDLENGAFGESETAPDGESDNYLKNAKESMDDFIIGYQAPQDYEPVPYLTHEEMQRTKDSSFVVGINETSERNNTVDQALSAAQRSGTSAAEKQTRQGVKKTSKLRSDVADLLDDLDKKD